MAIAWTLEYNGSVKPLFSWGIRRPRLTFRSLDIDELTFEIPRSDALTSAIFPAGAELILRRNTVGWFRGKVRRTSVVATAHGEAESYVVHNAWSSLARTVYQQGWCVNGGMQNTPRVTLGQNQYGQKISIGRQISEILTYALTKAIVIAPGILPELTPCWKEEMRDLTCAGAIRNVLKLLPNAVSWFDYSAVLPTFNVRENTFLTALTLDAKAGDLILELSGITPRADLVPAGVTFIYQSTTTGADGRTMTTLTRDTAGVGDMEGSIVSLIELLPGDTPPAGAAGAYYASLLVTPFEGSIITLEDECSGQLRPGKVLNLANGRPEWATMRAVIQIVTEDLFTGQTTAQLGAPEHLAPQDFITQQQIARKRASVSDFAVVQPCQIADPAGSAGNPETGVPPTTKANPDAGMDPAAHDAVNKFQGIQNIKDPSKSGLSSQSLGYCDSETGESGTTLVYTPKPG